MELGARQANDEVEPRDAPNNGLHPTTDTTPVMLQQRGRRVMPGVGLLSVRRDKYAYPERDQS